MDRNLLSPLTDALETNLNQLLKAVNLLRQAYGEPLIVSSGYRPFAINSKVPGAAHNSAHMTCEAVDFSDPHGDLDAWCMRHLKDLETWGLFLEHPDATPTWCHVQTRKPHSGNRVFYP